MFGFGKSEEFDKNFDYDTVVSRYEGEVAVGDYVAETLNRGEINRLVTHLRRELRTGPQRDELSEIIRIAATTSPAATY